MKKVIFCAAALMIGAIGFAQVTDPYGSQGTASQAVEQANLPGSPSSANRGLSTQNGNTHKVLVQQIGTRQSVLTSQDNGSVAGGNQAWVMQNGNVSPASGNLNMAEVSQSGQTNSSMTEQYGDKNNAVTNQGQNNDASTDNRSLIRQGSSIGQGAEKNSAQVDQDGNRNLARMVQGHDNNDAWTIQEGDDNKSNVRQTANPNGSSGHVAFTHQEGLANESTIEQDGSARNKAATRQLGNDNKAYQKQNGNGGNSDGNNAFINQGDAAQFGVSTMSQSMHSRFDTYLGPWRGGNNNNSFNGIAIQDQTGTKNQAEVQQYGADNPPRNSDYAKQVQNGDKNQAYVVQNKFGTALGGGNQSLQNQNGDNNKAGVAQKGREHRAETDQQGNNNQIYSSQTNHNNDMIALQTGDNNVAHTIQTGSYNDIRLTQLNGSSYTVHQNNPSGGAGTGNYANIQQSGPNTTPGMTPASFTAQDITPSSFIVPALALPDSGL